MDIAITLHDFNALFYIFLKSLPLTAIFNGMSSAAAIWP